ncbi:nitrite reductase [Erwinia typographi]|uniref:Nitrite reductase (NADH) small subunit n=1 Tax=Erwinia typographi TaxID=371042 RepID=A0A0A3ZZL1_9GAMM|nr:nitrite reductase small subunit NirD [Erwinia typographi]KGT91038.1 nitrite reductase [Erwinia typographi]
MSHWYPVCSLESILPATGVCALVASQQVAVFRPGEDETVFALSNIDPFAQASVLSRGIIAEHQQELWVASPLKKQRFRLRDGLCMEEESRSIASYRARVRDGQVEIAV